MLLKKQFPQEIYQKMDLKNLEVDLIHKKDFLHNHFLIPIDLSYSYLKSSL